MNELLSKVSSYNIFNYLFPGAVFAVLSERLGMLKMPHNDIVTTLLLYYVIGLTISRVGSVLIEPVARRVGFVKYADYPSYVRACSKDTKLEVLLEVSNTYRTLATAFLLLLVGYTFGDVGAKVGMSVGWRNALALIALFTLFLFSFRKQSGYISKRVENGSGS